MSNDDENVREEQADPEQEREERTSRKTGGDAEAAGSIEEREAVARDEDDEFSQD